MHLAYMYLTGQAMIDERYFEEIWREVDRVRLGTPGQKFATTSSYEEAVAEALAIVIDKDGLVFEQGTMPSLLRRLNTWLYKTVAKGLEEGAQEFMLLDYARKHYPNDCKHLDEEPLPRTSPKLVEPPKPRRSRYLETGMMPLKEYLAAGLDQEFNDGPITAQERVRFNLTPRKE